MYLSSADFMTRNQDRRVEVGGPVRSPELKQFLEDYLNLVLSDNTLDYLLGEAPEVFNATNADIDENENINIKDLSLLIDMLLIGSNE